MLRKAALSFLIALTAFASAQGADVRLLARSAPTQMIVLSDSRANFGLGDTVGGSAYSITQGAGASYVGWLHSALGNRVISPNWYNFGLTGASSLNVLNRIGSASNSTGVGTQPGGTINTAASWNPSFNTGVGCNGLNAGTGNGADKGWNVPSDGIHSVLGAAKSYVAMMIGVNDPISTNNFYVPSGACSPAVPIAKWSMIEISAILDKLTAAGHDVWLSNETPGGQYTVWSESRIPSSGSWTPVNTTGFKDGDSFFPGNSGAVVFETGSTDTQIVATKIAGSSCDGVTGHYVLVGTSYTACGTPPDHAFISYVWSSTNTTTYASFTPYRLALHNWLSSSAANFVDNGNDYLMPGALFGRGGQVHSWDTWGVKIDPATVGSTYWSLPGTLFDGLHDSSLGGELESDALVTMVNADYPSLTANLAPSPTKNNATIATVSSSATHFTGSLCGPATSAGFAVSDVAAGGVIFRVYRTAPGRSMDIISDDGSGNLVGAALTGATHTLGHTGACSYDFTLAVTPGNGNFIVAELDQSNLLINGQQDLSEGAGTNNGSNTVLTGGAIIPKSWTWAPDAATNTAAVATTGTLRMSVSNGLDDQGFPAVTFTFEGNPATGTASTFSQSIPLPDVRAAGGPKLRFQGRVKVDGATCGGGKHLYGLYSANLSTAVTEQTGTTFNRPGYTTNFTSMSVVAQQGATAQPYTDQNLYKAMVQQQVTPPLDLGIITLGSASALTPRLNLNYRPSSPVCFAVTVSQLKLSAYAQ